MTTIYLRDDQWEKIHEFLQDHPRVHVGKEATCRRFVEATLWYARTGAQYRELPVERGKWNSVYKRYARWSRHGVWADMFSYFSDDPDLENVMVDSTVVRAHMCAAGAPHKKEKEVIEAASEDNRQDEEVAVADSQDESADEALGRSRGGFSTKIHVKVDGLGNPIHIHLTGGQRADISQGKALLADGIAGDNFLADKGYDGDDFVGLVVSCGANPVIPPRSNRKQPRSYDEELYKERHLVECFINKLKWFRRVFSRFDKYDLHYLSYIHFVSTLIWLR